MSFVPEAQIIVVDTGQDDSLEQLKRRFPDLDAFRVSNHSMANAVNEGLKRAQKPFILQMNADVYLEASSVPDLLNVLNRANVGMVGPLCYKQDGRLQNQGLLYQRYFQVLRLAKGRSLKVNWLSGACMMIKQTALMQVGGMNSSLRFYNEDIEWSWRFRKAGWQCRLVSTPVTHLGGSSTPKNPKFLVEGYRGGYLLSKWYKPKLYQALHRFIVRLEARIKKNHPDPLTREAYQAIEKMFIDNSFETSPFGKTLAD